MSEHAALALELEVLVARAVRLGFLDVGELLPAYMQLAPASHPALADPRCVDVEAVARALAGLPPESFAAGELLVVRRLDEYSHAPSRGELRAGVLSDGTVVLEATLGLVSVLELAAALCLLRHEVDKAGALIPDLQARADAAEPDFLSHLAFAWGTDPGTVAAQNEATGDLLLRVLTGDAALPDVRFHADLQPEATRRRGTRDGERLAGMLAEMGLAARPLHLWIGDAVVIDCLSPYPRELREPLRAWAATRPAALAADCDGAAPSEALLYALAHDFVCTDDGLLEERDIAERSVGIVRLRAGDLDVEAADLARIDFAVCDARLGPWSGGAAPVLLRLPEQIADPEATLLRTVLTALGSQVTGVTLVHEATLLAGAPGSVVLPELLLRWAGEHKLSMPAASPLEPAELQSWTDGSVQRGTLLATPSARLVSAARLVELATHYRVAGVSIGGDSAAAAIADAIHRGTIPRGTPVGWAAVATQQTATGRPDLASLGGLSAVAIATLRRLAPPPAEIEPPAKRRPPPRQSGRGAVRIKA